MAGGQTVANTPDMVISGVCCRFRTGGLRVAPLEHDMFKQSFMGAALLVSAFALTACDKKPTDPIVPKAVASETPIAPVPDTSLPSATEALKAPDGKTDAPANATFNNTPMTPSSESTAMPMGGQANDHSAPKPGEGASAASAAN